MQYNLSREYYFLRSISKYTDKYTTWQTAGWPIKVSNEVNLLLALKKRRYMNKKKTVWFVNSS